MRSMQTRLPLVQTLAISLVLTLLMALMPPVALAAEVRTDEATLIDSATVVDDDLYAFGDTVEIRGTVNGDVISGARHVIISGVVNGDVMAGAANVEIPGRVEGAVRASGGNIMIDGTISDDVLIGGGTVRFGPSARVGRDLLIGGGTVSLDGETARNVRVAGGDLSIGGRVGGDVRADVGQLTIGDRAIVAGSLVYSAEQAANVAPGATVQGQTQRLATPEPAEPTATEQAAAVLMHWLQALVAMLLVGLTLVTVFPVLSRRATNTLNTSPWASVGVGLALFVGVPLLALVVLIAGFFIGGWWLAPILLGLYAAALVFGVAASGLFLGRTLLLQIGRGGLNPLTGLVVGLAILTLIGQIPILGGVIGLIAALAGLGALGRAFWLAQSGDPAAAIA